MFAFLRFSKTWKINKHVSKLTFSDGVAPGSRPECQNDTLFWTKSVSILIEIKEIGSKTYSNSYKKLMVLRKSNRVEQNRCGNDRNSWNPMKMINPTHFFLKSVSDQWKWVISHSKGGEMVGFGLNWGGLDFLFAQQQAGIWTELNWPEPNWSEVKWNEL